MYSVNITFKTQNKPTFVWPITECLTNLQWFLQSCPFVPSKLVSPKNILRDWQTYIITNASYEGIYVKLERKNNATLVFLLSNCLITMYRNSQNNSLRSVKKKSLSTIIFDNFGTWLLGYRFEFSCLYIPQGHYFISTLWLWSTHEYVVFLF